MFARQLRLAGAASLAPVLALASTQASAPYAVCEDPQNSLEGNTMIVAGTAVQSLGESISGSLGLSKGDVSVRRFSDGEIHCRFNESVREKNLYIIQSCAAPVMLVMSEVIGHGPNDYDA